VIKEKSPAIGNRAAVKPAKIWLRLYIAGATPNSARAALNLDAALKEFDDKGASLGLEIVDVFLNPKRAITEGVIATPTLIGLGPHRWLTIMGDLTDAIKLRLFLQIIRDAARAEMDENCG
jgi:circadian clock protein KaiB